MGSSNHAMGESMLRKHCMPFNSYVGQGVWHPNARVRAKTQINPSTAPIARMCIILLAALFAALGCEAGDGSGEQVHTGVAVSTAALSAGAAGSAAPQVGSKKQEVTFATLPFSVCTLTSTLMKTTLHVFADEVGIVHLWSEPSPTSHKYTLDCDESGSSVRYSFDLADPKTFVPAVARGAAPAHKVLPPLTDPMSMSQSELIKAGYGVRPDPNSPLFATWAEAVSKPLTVVAPRSVPNPWASNDPQSFTTSPIWDGIALNQPNMLYWAAIGAFTIPAFTVQANQGQTYHNGLWPGVGGGYERHRRTAAYSRWSGFSE